MKKQTTKKKTNKKLLSAFAMFMLSGAMLGSATYAWFTMSREVEVKNIQLTASTPVNIQLSMGENMYNAMTTTTAKLSSGSDAGGIVAAPANDDKSKDWADSVAFYDFYAAPLITPASSNNGTTIYTTQDMNGVGRTIKAAGQSSSGTKADLALKDTLQNVTPENSGTTPAWNENNYIDFPVWFRTSKTTDVQLAVKATVYKGDNPSAKQPGSGTDLALYKAARVSILNSTNGTSWTSNGVIIPYASDGTNETAQDATKYYSGKALSSTGAITSSGTEASREGAYTAPTVVTQNSGTGNGGDPVITIAGKGSSTSTYNGGATNSSQVYGNATCVIVRVWLEGEDKDCWNATEGQDFKVNLTFVDKDQ